MTYKAYQVRELPKKKAIMFNFFDKITSIFIKSKPIKEKNFKKILLIRNDHIGDLVLDTSIFREIRKKFPEAEITALISPETKQIIEKDPNIDKIITLGLFWRKKNLSFFMEYMRILKQIKREKFDVGIDIRGSFMSIIFLLWAPKIRKRVGYYNITGGKAFLTNPIFLDKEENTIYFDMKLAEKGLNFKAKNYWPKIVTDKQDEKEVDFFIKKNNLKKFICICPGSTNELKQWDEDKFNRIIKNFNLKYPKYKILLIGGGEDKALINRLAENKNCISLINFNLRLLSLLFKRSKLVIATDGGPMHIAWVSDSNLIALWGPINLIQMKPLKKSIVIHHKLECYPCHTKKCIKGKGKRCMDLITVNEVEKSIKKILKNDK